MANTQPTRPMSRFIYIYIYIYSSLWFWLFPKLTGCRYEIIEEMKEAVTKVIDMLTQGDFHEAL